MMVGAERLDSNPIKYVVSYSIHLPLEKIVKQLGIDDSYLHSLWDSDEDDSLDDSCIENYLQCSHSCVDIRRY